VKVHPSALKHGVSHEDAAQAADWSQWSSDYRRPIHTFEETISTVIALHFY
jgi:hypothetical protein